jgi:hypothetical protein
MGALTTYVSTADVSGSMPSSMRIRRTRR